MADRSTLNAARAAFSAARLHIDVPPVPIPPNPPIPPQAPTGLVPVLYKLDQAKQALLAAERVRVVAESDPVRVTKNNAEADVAAARQAEATARAALQTAIQNWLPNAGAGTEAETLTQEFARLEKLHAADLYAPPIVLFPVRLETRFEGAILKIRVFPDEVLLNTHEAALTDEERAAGEKYYDDYYGAPPAPPVPEKILWQKLVARFGPERSAYIVRILMPSVAHPGSCPGNWPGYRRDPHLDVPGRAATWTRPGEAVLPDRWIVVTFRHGKRRITLGSPILEPLALTPDPGLPATDQVEIDAGSNYKIDKNLLWTVNFSAAKAVGMGIEVGLDSLEAATDGSGGFDRVLVFGVKSSLDPQATGKYLQELFDAHHYSRGLAIVRQGTPTNNMENSPTPYPPADNAGETSFAVEREFGPSHPTAAVRNCLDPNTDGFALTRLLGVQSTVAANIARGAEHEIYYAGQMNRALWPATYSYFLNTMMNPVVTGGIGNAKEYFCNHVRARGPAPAFRVGAVPYGLLPITSLYRFVAEADITATPPVVLSPAEIARNKDRAVERAIVGPLRNFVRIWLDASRNAPRIKPNSLTPDEDLTRVLATYASSREVRLRGAVGALTQFNLFSFLGISFLQSKQALDALAETLAQNLGFPSWRPFINQLVFDERAYRYVGKWVNEGATPERLSESEGLNSDYILSIINAIPSALQAEASTGKSLLHTLLRHSTLIEYVRLLTGQPAGVLPLPAEGREEREPVDFPSPPPKKPPVRTFATDLDPTPSRQHPLLDPAKAKAHGDALDTLRGLPTAELERLLTESLDLASHRLDAWVTALATRRIRRHREIEDARLDAPTLPFSSFLGGYSWVENLRPVQRTLGSGGVEIQAGNGGFIHAPSLSHAAAAAVLRSGHMTFRVENPQKCAIDLSSRQVRRGLTILDEVRAGQPLGAVLGYRFERALHEGGYDPGLGLDAVRFVLRNLFPLVAGKDGIDTTEPAEVIAARNVVDGLALLRANRAGQIPFGTNPKLPGTNTSGYNAIQAELTALERQLDAVADLLTAESVFQLARGNIAGATSTLDNLMKGGKPPEISIAQTPRAGLGVTHRVAWVFPSGGPNPWSTPLTARALAEPALDGWLGNLLGNPTLVTCRVSFSEVPGFRDVKLSELGLRPLDFLALARSISEPGLGSLLDERVLSVVLADGVPRTNLQIDYSRPSRVNLDTERTFLELLEVARAFAKVLGSARPLRASDLMSPAEAGLSPDELQATSENLSGIDLASRVSSARDTLQRVASEPAVQPSLAYALTFAANPLNSPADSIRELRIALKAAAEFAPERAFPPHAAALSELVELATAMQVELLRRDEAIADSPLPDESVARWLEWGAGALRHLFGSDFVALPRVKPPRSQELALALAARETLLGAVPANPPAPAIPSDQRAPDRYLQQAMRSHATLGRFRSFSLLARAIGWTKPKLEVLQFPYVAGERWLGLPFVNGITPVEGRAATLVLSETPALDPTLVWSGLLLEQWAEVIPKQEQTTGIAFHYDTPRSSAPQAVLVAVPASPGPNWLFEELLDAINETLDLAKVRAVDSEQLPIGQLLPGIILPQNIASDVTVTSSFLDRIRAASLEAFKGFLP